MSTPQFARRTPAQRQAAYLGRATTRLPVITLDAEHAAALDALLLRTGLSRAALIRQLIADAARCASRGE